MSEEQEGNAREHHHQDPSVGSPATQQMRTVGQRRRDAEEKLEHHLEEAARHSDDTGKDAAGNAGAAEDGGAEDGAAGKEDAGEVDGRDVAAIQNDDRLTAADRVDLIANQVVPQAEDGEGSPGPGKGS